LCCWIMGRNKRDCYCCCCIAAVALLLSLFTPATFVGVSGQG
jgi:hypothetical protein